MQLCQLGLKEKNNYDFLIKNYQTISINKTLSQIFGLKRASSSLSCSDMLDLGSQLSSISANYLSSIDPKEFYECQTFLGSTVWSSSQLNALAIVAKAVIF